MGTIKKILYLLLSQNTYFRLLHRGFYVLFDLGILRNDPKFKYHYMVKKVIEPSFTVIDIGANLGYFSRNFARLAKKGKLISVEPVPQFYSVLSYFMKKYPNTVVYNVALGNEAGSVTMVMPETNGMVRTGLPHISKSEEDLANFKTQEVKIIKGTELFKDCEKIDYIKCDIEGYELTVFEEIKPVLEKHQPYVQLEISTENTSKLLALMHGLQYTQFGISNFEFVREMGAQKEEGDYFFVPESKLASFCKKFNITSI